MVIVKCFRWRKSQIGQSLKKIASLQQAVDTLRADSNSCACEPCFKIDFLNIIFCDWMEFVLSKSFKMGWILSMLGPCRNDWPAICGQVSGFLTVLLEVDNHLLTCLTGTPKIPDRHGHYTEIHSQVKVLHRSCCQHQLKQAELVIAGIRASGDDLFSLLTSDLASNTLKAWKREYL